MTNQNSTFPREPKWVIDRPLMDAIVIALVTDQIQTPTLPEFNQQIPTLADQVYNLDELNYYLDAPETDVTLSHIREAGLKLAAKAIRFLQSLPNE